MSIKSFQQDSAFFSLLSSAALHNFSILLKSPLIWALCLKCSGQLILATALESLYLTSDSFAAKRAL